jgi:hypothetical protein
VKISSWVVVGVATFVVPMLTANDASAIQWRDANGKSCEQVCATPLSTDKYRSPDARENGQSFYVCRAEGGNGWRPGFNLLPNWAKHCWIPIGGKELSKRPYQCACE